MNYGFLCPLKNKELALFFPDGPAYEPHPILGVAHTAQETGKEEKLSLFSPRELTEKEREQLDTQLYDFVHDVEYRIRARRYLGKAVFTPATEWLLGRFHFVLQIFGLGGIIMCMILGRYRADDIATGIYWVALLPMFVAIARGLIATHGRETLGGLRKLYYAPTGIRIVVLPQLEKIEEMVNNGGSYAQVLQQVRDLGLKELILFYKRASQYPRWVSKPPNYAGVIRGRGR